MSSNEDERATVAETRRLRALEDQVTAFAAAIRGHLPPLIGFYPPEARAQLEEAKTARESIKEVFRLAVEAATMLERCREEGASSVALRLRQWCEWNRERCE